MKIGKHIFFCFLSCLILCSLRGEQLPEDVDLSAPMMKSPDRLLFDQRIARSINEADGLLFDQQATGFHTFVSCMWDSVQPYWTRFVDNFTLEDGGAVDSLVWWGGHW